MQTNIRLATWLAAVSVLAWAPTASADHEKSAKQQLSANEFIGKKVVNHQNEDLGKVHDLIINVDSGSIPYAVISSGFGARNKVAVPLEALSCNTNDGKSLVLAASKDDLKAASKSPQGRWYIVENSEWTKTVDGYYGEPTVEARERYARQRASEGDTRVFTRDQTTVKGAERLMQPADRALCEKICDTIENVSVEVDNGVAHLYGSVESEQARQSLESKVRAVPGVQRVESHLKVRNK